MNLRTVDLNLLVVLDALLTDLHVTRAAERIGLSQPAVSNALGRLRQIFGDELLVRTASGMQATPRALELVAPTKQILRQIERVLEGDAAYDPAHSDRTFVVRLSDLLGLLLLPTLTKRIEKVSPNVRLDTLHLSPNRTIEALEKDEIDVAVSMGLQHSSSIRSRILFSDRMVCVMRRGHSLAKNELTLGRFLKQRHLTVSMSPTDLRFVDDILAREELKRDVALNVSHWLLVPHVLMQTNLVAVMSDRLASAIGKNALVTRSLPFASDAYNWEMYWHRRHDGNPAISWLREKITEAAISLT